MADNATAPAGSGNKKSNLMFEHEIKGLKATRIGEFTRAGERRYRYAITGTPAALEAWKIARGQYYLEDEVTKQVIFIAIPSVAIQLMKSGGKMLISTNGSVVPDYDSLEEMYEDDVMYRQAFAQAKAQQDVSNLSNRLKAPRTAAPNRFIVPDQERINSNVENENLNLTDEERDALANQANAQVQGGSNSPNKEPGANANANKQEPEPHLP